MLSKGRNSNTKLNYQGQYSGRGRPESVHIQRGRGEQREEGGVRHLPDKVTKASSETGLKEKREINNRHFEVEKKRIQKAYIGFGVFFLKQTDHVAESHRANQGPGKSYVFCFGSHGDASEPTAQSLLPPTPPHEEEMTKRSA